MAKQPKLDYDSIEVLYNYGYNTKEIAALLGSVNGHISKVLRHLGVPTRKRGEVAHKTAFYDMDSDAQTLLGDYKAALDDMYQNWAEKLKSKQPKKVTTVKRKAKAKVSKEEKAQNVEVVHHETLQADDKTENDAMVVPNESNEVKAVEAETDILDELAEDTEPVGAVEKPATIELEVEKTEEGYEILRGEAFRSADLMVQGSIIQHFINKGMAQRPIAKELEIAQSNVSRIWSKFKKANK
ncbi:hypothetical protein FT641_19565 [Bacillus paranthracis]|uniref:helix-turn-helix transcriptional regulator n=1 Tax=Bacillus paranthracis TaxID=2026186 RepID=UPI0018794576|nr:hypothetical protein [Bacillus paranthracis]MBE7114235.1 hypothetical protein [Bacillus paranthracis]MBE7154892.1 hypothetical protein [Bacillus paranthracis]